MGLLIRLFPLLILLLALINPSISARTAATSFCKCICFTNSTIIALNPPPSTTSAASLHNLDIRSPQDGEPSTEADVKPSRPHHKLTCADCTRAFCLDYNLPICKNAREEDVFTTCFQRDSLKDETVVVIFLFVTAGLLAWAVVKPWVDQLRERNTFMPLAQNDRTRSSGVRGQGAARSQEAPRRAGFGDQHSGGDSSSGSRNGRRSQRAGEPTRYAEEMHADQDAVDIVSSTPSSSRPGFRS